jgi:hypothetical protein
MRVTANAPDAPLPDSPDGRAQITRFSVALGGHLGYRAAAHNSGYGAPALPVATRLIVANL